MNWFEKFQKGYPTAEKLIKVCRLEKGKVYQVTTKADCANFRKLLGKIDSTHQTTETKPQRVTQSPSDKLQEKDNKQINNMISSLLHYSSILMIRSTNIHCLVILTNCLNHRKTLAPVTIGPRFHEHPIKFYHISDYISRNVKNFNI